MMPDPLESEMSTNLFEFVSVTRLRLPRESLPQTSASSNGKSYTTDQSFICQELCLIGYPQVLEITKPPNFGGFV